MRHHKRASLPRRTRRARGGRGAVAVEFGLIAPLFILLVLGIVDFGYMINRDTLINNLTRDAARSASMNMSFTSVQQEVYADLAKHGFCDDSGGGSVTCPSGIEVVISCVNDPSAMQALEQYDPSNPSADTIPSSCGSAASSPGGGALNSFDTNAVRGSVVSVKVHVEHKWITPLGAVCSLFDGDGDKCFGKTIVLEKTAKMARE